MGKIALATQNRQRSPERLVPRDRQAMELLAIVISGEAGRLLKSPRLKFKFRFGAVDKMLLPSRDKGLVDPGADRFARKEAQPARARRKRKDFFGMGRTQPLEIERQALG